MTALRVGLLTSESRADLHEDDRRLVEPLARRGVEAVPVVWSTDATRRPRDLAGLVVRSIWDYVERFDELTAFLDAAEASEVTMHNPPSLVRWNVDKRYLLDLASRGAPVLPTELLRAHERHRLRDVLRDRGWEEAIVKPVVGASARGLTRVSEGSSLDDAWPGDLLVQRFEPEIVHGELSFVFFGGELSHVVRKRPPPGDFRAQEHLGGTTALEPSPPEALARSARASLRIACPTPPLYARVDGIPRGDTLLVMELELAEPLLYLGWSEGAADRFADAIARTFREPRPARWAEPSDP